MKHISLLRQYSREYTEDAYIAQITASVWSGSISCPCSIKFDDVGSVEPEIVAAPADAVLAAEYVALSDFFF